MSNPNRPMTRHSRLRSGDSAKHAPRKAIEAAPNHTNVAERSAGAAHLDVERLREAMHNENWCKNEWLHERIHDPDDDTIHTLEELADEYARLASEGTDR